MTRPRRDQQLAVIAADSFYVEAFFRETFVENLRNDDRAAVTLMSYPDTPLESKVGSIGRGIAGGCIRAVARTSRLRSIPAVYLACKRSSAR